MKQVENKVAAITGAASGIGQALAIELAQKGCHLALADIDQSSLILTLDSIRRSVGDNVRISTHVIDVADRDAMFAYAESALQIHDAVHIVINNAGVAVADTLTDISYQDFEWLFDINFWGVVNGCKAFLPVLQRQEEACIINISSIFGLVCAPTLGSYIAAKHAVTGFSNTLRIELDALNNTVSRLSINNASDNRRNDLGNKGVGINNACKISVSTVHPGGIKTNIAINGRTGKLSQFIGKEESVSSIFDKLSFTTAEKTAQDIINKGIIKGKRRVLIGPDAIVMDLIQRAIPSLYQKLLYFLVRRHQVQQNILDG